MSGSNVRALRAADGAPGLFDYSRRIEAAPVLSTEQSKAIDHYPTPLWAAEALYERYFSDVTARDCVLEPSCGEGNMLRAIPDGIPAIGVELDPALAAEAARRTNRRIIVGDFSTVEIDFAPTVIFGNPPFQSSLIDAFLERAFKLLPEEGRLGFLLPTCYFQTASTVVRLARSWSLSQDLVPRNLYPGLRLPLTFAVMTKTPIRRLVGFALYEETAALADLRAPVREALSNAPKAIWRTVVEDTLRALGGKATLADIYQAIEARRPTGNTFWREKVRQTLQRIGERVAPATWALPQAA